MPEIGQRVAQLYQGSDENINIRSKHGQFKSLQEAQAKAKDVAASDVEDAVIVEKNGVYEVFGTDEVGTLDASGNTPNKYEMHDFEANVINFVVTKRDERGLRQGGEAISRLGQDNRQEVVWDPNSKTEEPQTQQTRNRDVAAEVTREVAKLGLWSSNKWELKAIPAVVGVLSSRAYTGHGYKNYDVAEVQHIANTAKATGYGNCRENACVSAQMLAEKGVPMVEVYSKENHAFVVIGRDPNSDSSKPETWGPNAYIVDGWMQKSYQATKENLSKFMFDGETPDVWRSIGVTDEKGNIQ